MRKILFLALLALSSNAFSFSPSDDPNLEVIDKVEPFTVYLDTRYSKPSSDNQEIIQASLLVEHNYTGQTRKDAIWLERDTYFINCKNGTWWLPSKQVTTFDDKKFKFEPMKDYEKIIPNSYQEKIAESVCKRLGEKYHHQ